MTVNISKGLGDGSVPDLRGKSRAKLADYLEAAGFKLGTVSEEASEEEKGTVLSQDPDAGEEVEKGTAINVVVSDGSKAKATVPYLVGKSINDAQSALSKAGLSLGSISYEYIHMQREKSSGSSTMPMHNDKDFRADPCQQGRETDRNTDRTG